MPSHHSCQSPSLECSLVGELLGTRAGRQRGALACANLKLEVQPAGSSGGPEAGEEQAGWKGLSSWPVSAGLWMLFAVFSCLRYLSFPLHGRASLVAQLVKNPSALRETWV